MKGGRRHANKVAARYARRLRRCLVHDAGCVQEGCKYHVHSFSLGDFTYIPAWVPRLGDKSVAVPRSLRPFLGASINGNWSVDH